MEKALEIFVNGLSTGAIYSLLALGFVLIFKSTGVLNFAQGEISMVGAFFCYTFSTLLGLPYWISFVLVACLGGFLGIAIDYLFLRRMVGEPIFSTIMVTVGLASILTSGAGLIWGHDVYSIIAPFTDKTISVGEIIVSQGALYTIGISIIFFVIFSIFFNRSVLGIAMRGTSEDPHTAGLMGINVKRIHMIAWAIGSVVAVIAGIFLADQSFVRLSMSHTGIKAMAAAILGGMESIRGAIIGGAIIGLAESFAASYLSGMVVAGFHFGDVKDVVAFSIMIVALMIRPYGIFGHEKVERV